MMSTPPNSRPTPVSCRLYYEPAETTASPEALSEWFSRQSHPVVLGGHAGSRWMGGWSLWAAGPRCLLCCPVGHHDPMSMLNRHLAGYQRQTAGVPCDCAFGGGWIGFFSYDLGDALEPVGASGLRDLNCPWIHLAFYDRWIAWDHGTDTVWLGCLETSDDPTPAATKLAEMNLALRHAERTAVPSLPGIDVDRVPLDNLRSNINRGQYLRVIADIRRRIHDGQVYQVNLSQRFARVYPYAPVHLMHWQNRYNPSPYAALVQTPGAAVVSASPELFLAVSRGRIITRPIKGTRRRHLAGPDAESRNRRARLELDASRKDRAELTMIVDLERNDLARVCMPGTRKVLQHRVIEQYATVFHGVATIEGKLARPQAPDWLETILRATFPGGSITGAPKIRARQIIGQLEPTCRGVYTGAIGWIGLDNALELNIAIRTVFVQDGIAYLQAGGGIVADSDPCDEYEETLTKARALIAGIEAIGRAASLGRGRSRIVDSAAARARADRRKERGHGRPCP